MCGFDHVKEAVWLLKAVDGPRGAKLFVTTMFRVYLSEHEELRICRVPCDWTI